MTLMYALPSLCFFILMKLPVVLSLGLYERIGIALILQLIIYLIVLRFYGIQIVDWIKKVL